MSSVPAALAPYVSTLHEYDVEGATGVHIGMPSTSLTLVLPLDEQLDVSWSGDGLTRRRFWANVSGLHLRPAEIHHGPRQRGIMLGLTVAGARTLLGLPAKELSGHLLDLDEVAPELADLPEQLAETPAEQRSSLVTRRLAEVLARRDVPGPRAEVARALSRLTRGVPVADVAHDVGFSRRHLHQLVVTESGLSPKQFQRLARFERSHALVGERVGLAQVAARCGYADQSHLAREWRDLAGCSPREWQRRELPIVQDTAVSPGA